MDGVQPTHSTTVRFKRKSTLANAREADGEQLSTYNSFFRRRVTRQNPSAILEEGDRKQRLLCDFLGLITAVNGLYSQKGMLPMQQLDNQSKRHIGEGAVFEVTSIQAESMRPSQTVARALVSEKKEVIVKASPLTMFDSNGRLLDKPENQQAAASFLMELRVLSFPTVRSSENIVKLMGVGWKYGPSMHVPTPSLILERAYSTLADFQHRHQNLPYITKQQLCTDVANGLAALHECGIIHGDVKLDNILIFEGHRFIAKVADFSHAMLDTGEVTHLVGGTALYTAPEWQDKLPTKSLMQTDVYSFGLVFASTILGYDVIEEFLRQSTNGRTEEERAENLTLKKKDGTIKEHIIDLMYNLYDIDLFSELDYIPVVNGILELTLQVQSSKRNLKSVIKRLSGLNNMSSQQHGVTVLRQIDSDILAIPYQALRNMSRLLKKQVIRALKAVADDPSDDRRAAACWELCICAASGFGMEVDNQEAMQWLLKSAELNDHWGRSMIHRVADALGQTIPDHFPVNEWLINAAEQGSEVAYSSLLERGESFDRRSIYRSQAKFTSMGTRRLFDTERISETREEDENENMQDLSYPQDSWGNTKVHLAILAGDRAIISMMSSCNSEQKDRALNAQNKQGDTPLLLACKIGDFSLLKSLLSLGADPCISNTNSENCLHHLASFSDLEAADVADLLYEAGVDSTAEASATSLMSEFRVFPDASGCPKVKSILVNRPRILDIIMTKDNLSKSTMNERQRRMLEITPRKLVAWACRTSSLPALEIIYRHSPAIFEEQSLNDFEMWIDGRRYSLAALAIAGCVGERPTIGFNYPEAFHRYLVYGSSAQNQFTGVFRFLLDKRLDFRTRLCHGERNALFFGIEAARPEVVEFLLSLGADGDEFAVFGKTSYYDENARSVKHRRKRNLINAIGLAISLDNSVIFRSLLRYSNGEALDEGPVFPVSFSSLQPEYSFFRRRKYSGSSRTKVSHLFGPLSNIQHISSHKAPYGLYSCPDGEPPSPGEKIFDGKLNYAVLYMGLIARAAHRDIELAHVLLQEIQICGISTTQPWSIRNALEYHSFPEVCFSPLYMSILLGWQSLSDLLVQHGAEINFKTHPYRHASQSVLRCLLNSKKSNLFEWLGGFPPTTSSTRLRFTIYFLKAITDNDKSCDPLTEEDWNSVVFANKLFEDAEQAELWKTVLQIYRDRKRCRLIHIKGIADLILSEGNIHALRASHELGLSLTGTWKQRIFGKTPMDSIATRHNTSDETRWSNDKMCRKLVLENGGRRSLVYTLEGQIIGNFVIDVFLAALIYAIFGTVEYQHSACVKLIETWSEAYKDNNINAWTLIFRIPFAYSPFIPLIIAILTLIFLCLTWLEEASFSLSDIHQVVKFSLFSFSVYTIEGFSDSFSQDRRSQLGGPSWKILRPYLDRFDLWRDKRKLKKSGKDVESIPVPEPASNLSLRGLDDHGQYRSPSFSSEIYNPVESEQDPRFERS